ncbi:hypothetical protein [Micromonospora sp. SH-82]|uniref:hypothetical protein n=1 Tax=Micromonospora sp. SH-82 TaxID=3132938 RepID=UPI003EBC5533
MLSLPATRLDPLGTHHRHRVRIGSILGLLAMFGTATAILVAAPDPAGSTDRVQHPSPAPAIFVVEESAPVTDLDPYSTGTPAGTSTYPPGPVRTPGAVPAGVGGGSAVGDPRRGGRAGDEVPSSLFWSGVGGLVVSLTGMSMLGVRRRMW